MALNHVTSEHYLKYSGPIKKWTRSAIQEYLSGRSYSKVLDIGCGPGQNTQYIADFVHADTVTGIDVDPGFLQHAKDTCDESVFHFYNFDLDKSDWIDKMINDKKYDLIFSSFFINWTNNIKVLFEKSIRCLKPGGESFLVFGIKLSEAFKFTMKSLFEDPNWERYFRNFIEIPNWMAFENEINSGVDLQEPAFEKILVATGYKVLQCHTKQVSYITKSRDESKGMLQWLLPMVPFIPDIRLEEFMEQALNIYEKYAIKATNEHGDVCSENLIWSTKILIAHLRCPLKETHTFQNPSEH